MTSPQRLPASLTTLEAALGALLNGLEPVSAVELPLADALRGIAAEMPPLSALPPHDIASADGFAFRARDLVGASSYSPLPLSASPVWVEAGDAMPDGCDCVLDADAVDRSGSMVQVLSEAIPGQGVRRAGSDIAGGSFAVTAGRRILAARSPDRACGGTADFEGAAAAPADRQYSRWHAHGRFDCGKRTRRRRRSFSRRGRRVATSVRLPGRSNPAAAICC